MNGTELELYIPIRFMRNGLLRCHRFIKIKFACINFMILMFEKKLVVVYYVTTQLISSSFDTTTVFASLTFERSILFVS